MAAGPSAIEPVGRLAPSPTGVLHLGNARTFLATWLDIRARGGSLLLRIEDIDGPRVRADAIPRLFEDLDWLGLDHDGDVAVQSTRLAVYARVVDGLIARGLAYPCVCTRSEVERAASAPHEDGQDGAPYPGTCRGRFASRDEARARSSREPSVRFLVDRPARAFVDRFRGAEPGLICGDFVIEKRDRGPAYQLAVVVDDHRQGVTDVVRGDDLVPSTPRQLQLYDALSWQPPGFAHLPLVVGPDGRRLAKRHGDTSLRTLRARGLTAERVIGFLAWTLGLLPAAQDCRARDLVEHFALDKLPRERVVADEHSL